MMMDKLEVPRRRVRKNWYVGLHPDPVDRSHPDVHDDLLVEEASAMNSMSRMWSKHHCDFLIFHVLIPISQIFITFDQNVGLYGILFFSLIIKWLFW